MRSGEESKKHNEGITISLTLWKCPKSIELEDILLEKEKENDNGTINYNFTLKLKFYDASISETVEKNGKLTISTEDGLILTRDWEEKTTKILSEIF